MILIKNLNSNPALQHAVIWEMFLLTFQRNEFLCEHPSCYLSLLFLLLFLFMQQILGIYFLMLDATFI